MTDIKKTPEHIAVIMDGNGRWAQKQGLSRSDGHKAGAQAARNLIKSCVERKIKYLTLFAFGRDNWRRPQGEVDYIMELFLISLEQEVKKVSEHNVRFHLIGDHSSFSPELQKSIANLQNLTAQNDGLQLTIAINYSGRWDITQAVQKIVDKVKADPKCIESVTPEFFESHLSHANLLGKKPDQSCSDISGDGIFPDPDLLIRTSGEQRISDFMLWQLAYTEIVFSKVLWPDFDDKELGVALESFANRERRYGCTSEQLKVK